MATAVQSVFTFLFKYPPRVFQRGVLGIAPVLPIALIVAGLAVAIGVAVLAARALKGIRPVDRTVLAGLRIAVFVIVAGCLMRPALTLASAVPQRNVLAIACDDSRSMRIRDVDSTTRLATEQRVFADSTALVKQLADRFALRFFRFGADAAPVSGAAALTASGARTDIAAAFAAVRQELADMPLAGIVVVSDGADNATTDLAGGLLALRARRVPVYAVGVGKRTVRARRFRRSPRRARRRRSRDLARWSRRRSAARGLTAADSLVVTAEADGHIVASESARIVAGHDAVDVPLRIPALDVGGHVIAVHVAPLRGELITENNQAQALLRVRPPYERVLYLEGEPRFEFAFLRRAFEGDSAVRLVGLLRSAKGKFLRLNVADSLDLVSGFPTRREELFKYRALILGNIEASFFTGDQLRMIADFVDRRGGALIALGGRDALAEGGYAGTAVAEVLPFTLEHGGHRVDGHRDDRR